MAVKKKNKPADQAPDTSKVPLGLEDIVTAAGSFFGKYNTGSRRYFVPTPFNPDELAQRKGIKIYRQMALDEQIKSALLAKKYAVLSTGYEIQDAELDEAEEAADEEAREFVEFNFEEMAGSFDSKLLDILTALTYGFSLSEKVFGSIDYGPFDGKIGLKNLLTRPPDDIEFWTYETGLLADDGVSQSGKRFPKEKFVIYSYRSEFGNYYGNSDLREAYRAWWTKDNMMKMLAIALERYGEPIAVMTHEGTLTAQQTTDLTNFLKNLSSRSGILLPKSITLKFENPPPRTAEAFIPAINLYDQHMRIAVLMPGLLGLSGEQSAGSYARAVKEFDVFLWILGQLRKDLETLVNEQIVKPLLDMNYEIEHGKYPKFKFKELTEEARRAQFELFITGLSTGALVKGPEDENKLRELINWDPLPEDFVPPQPGLPPGFGGEEGLFPEEEGLPQPESDGEFPGSGDEEAFFFSSDRLFRRS